MYIFKESTIETELKYINGNFDYSVINISGESCIDGNILKANDCTSILNQNDALLKFSSARFLQIKQILEFLRVDLQKLNIDFSSYLKLHNERIIINNHIEDLRAYGTLRLVFKDSYRATHMKEIPITDNYVETIEKQIFSIVEKIKFIISNNGSKMRSLRLESIPVIFSSSAAGYFIHEILGHLLEDDMYPYCKNIFANVEFSKKLTVIDTTENYNKFIGLNKYDDMGIELNPLTLLKGGILNNIIGIDKKNSFDNKLYGMARRQSYKFYPLPRMRGTFIQPLDNMNQEEIISEYKDAIFIDKTYIGSVVPNLGSYTLIGNGFLIKDGEIRNFISKLKLTGDIIKSLNKIEYVGNDFDITVSDCVKFGQISRVCMGGPTISISDAMIEGEIYGTA